MGTDVTLLKCKMLLMRTIMDVLKRTGYTVHSHESCSVAKVKPKNRLPAVKKLPGCYSHFLIFGPIEHMQRLPLAKPADFWLTLLSLDWG